MPSSCSGPEIAKLGTVGKQSANHVLIAKQARRLDSRSGIASESWLETTLVLTRAKWRAPQSAR